MRWLLIVALLCTGCASALSASYKSLATVDKLVGAAAVAVPQLDQTMQVQIVRDAVSFDDGSGKLKTWREKIAPAYKAVEGAHAAVQLARDGIKDVAAGLRKPSDLGGWISAALNAAQNLVVLLAAVGITLPGGL